MKVKYGVLLVTALVIALLVPGFGRGGASQTITFLTAPWGVPPDQALLKAFTDRSGITVQVISAPSAEMYTKVQVASAGRRSPADVIRSEGRRAGHGRSCGIGRGSGGGRGRHGGWC